MKWTKIGRIFEPSHHALPSGCSEYAQAPQALVLDDCIRIYFSTRTRDHTGKFLSHIAFVEFDRQLTSILRVSVDPVIKLGELGCFDEHGIFPINVLQHQDKVYAFTCGWSRRTSVPVETSIGLAISRDSGLTFDKLGDGPVLASSLHQPFLVGDPFVAIYAETWHMWYIFGTRWTTSGPMETSPARVYKIGHATSTEGLTWVRENRQLISDTLNSDECQALPTVIEINNRYHMFFCYRQAMDFRINKHRGYRIGYAWSDDLHNWTRDDDSVGIGFSEGGWDSDMLCYPHVFRCDGSVYMLYNGNEFGRFGFGLARLEA